MDGKSQSTRREFLQGKAAAQTLAEVVAEALPAHELPEPNAGHYLVKLSRRAMACQFEVFLNAGQYDCGTEAAMAALDVVDQLEDQLSVFRPDSEVSRINREAADGRVAVEPRLFALLQHAAEIHQRAGGAYDITAGALSDAWGFTRRSGAIPDRDQLAVALARVGTQYLQLDAESQTVRFLIPGLQINLGSIGKGYALDRCAELLEQAGVHDFLLHGGNSSVLARGDRGGQPTGSGWWIGVRDPLHPEKRAGRVRLRGRALSTSGSGTQFFMHEGRRYGHILDPRTGWPAEGVFSVTALAPTAAEAEALSTATYVAGHESACELVSASSGASAIMFCPGQRLGRVERHRLALDDHDWSEEIE
jgi:FAD:protein FMN transferase